MRALGAAQALLPMSVAGEAVQLGKRYADEDLGLELLCTRGGEGALTIGESPLFLMGAKPLPASD